MATNECLIIYMIKHVKKLYLNIIDLNIVFDIVIVVFIIIYLFIYLFVKIELIVYSKYLKYDRLYIRTALIFTVWFKY